MVIMHHNFKIFLLPAMYFWRHNLNYLLALHMEFFWILSATIVFFEGVGEHKGYVPKIIAIISNIAVSVTQCCFLWIFYVYEPWSH